MPIQYVVGDTSPALSGVCRNDFGQGPVPVDGTSATSEVRVGRPYADPPRPAIVRPISVDAQGKWSMAWQESDLDVDGTWSVQVRMTFPGGGRFTFPRNTFTVEPLID